MLRNNSAFIILLCMRGNSKQVITSPGICSSLLTLTSSLQGNAKGLLATKWLYMVISGEKKPCKLNLCLESIL